MGFPSTEVLTIVFEDFAQDGDALEPIAWVAPRAGRITAAALGAEAAVAAADTNYNTFAIMNGTTSMASLANGPVSGGVSIAAGAFTGTFTLSATIASRAFDAGDVLTLESTKTGSGLAVAGPVLKLTVEYTD